MYLIAGSVSAYILTSSARVKGDIPQSQVQRTKAPCHASLKRVSKQKYVLRNRISSESVNSEDSGKGITRFSGGGGEGRRRREQASRHQQNTKRVIMTCLPVP